MKNILLLLAVLWEAGSAQAQFHRQRLDYMADAALTFGVRQGSLALSGTTVYQAGRQKRLQIGLGLRYTAYLGRDRNFITAPAILTSGRTGPAVFFTENITENIDTVVLERSAVHLLNVAFHTAYRIGRRWYLGFNIDLAGISFGSEQNGVYSHDGRETQVKARPATGNVLLISDNDLGSLNSELLVRYDLDHRWSIRGLFQFLFTEYRTGGEIQEAAGRRNDRFRNKVPAVGIGVTCHF